MIPTPSVDTDLRDYIKSRLGEHDPLNLHLVSAHCNGAGLGLNRADALDAHDYEHTGPGGIRNHDPKDLFWDADKVATVILECAEMDGPDLHTAVDALLLLPEETTKLDPADHVHAFEPGKEWEVCPGQWQCTRYPRIYDARVTRRGHTVTGSSQRVVRSAADDMARGLLSARSALALLGIDNEDTPMGAMARDALVRLNASITMLYPLMFPEHAAKNAAEDAARTATAIPDGAADGPAGGPVNNT